MSSNQENRHYTLKEQHNPGGSAVVLAEDHLLGFRSAGAQATGTYNETLLDYINKAIPGTYAGVPEAMQAFAANNSFTNWSSIGAKNGDEPPLVVQGNCKVSESGTVVTVVFDINVTTGVGQEAVGWDLWIDNRNVGFDSGVISTNEVRLTIKAGAIIKKDDRPILVYYDSGPGSLKGSGAGGLDVKSIFGQEIPNGSQQSG